MEKLLKHVVAFEGKHPQQRGVLQLFEARNKSTITSNASLAAYCFDPAFFLKTKDEGADEWGPDIERVPAADREPLKKYIGELYGGKDEEKQQQAMREWEQLLLHGVPKEFNASMELATARTTKHDKNGKVESVQLAGLDTRLRIWRKMLGQRYPALADVAKRILRMHATTCASERNWSLWGNLFTKARNRLGKERAEKLIYVRQNINVLQKSRVSVNDEEVVMALLEEAEAEGE